ncbi:MAG: glycosyltransferase family 1 protein [Candidatus Sericytochromatia bacterium]|nr:glycosyltransferase family 1 protein [Candidatus Sericytochromatia bacterium]
MRILVWSFVPPSPDSAYWHWLKGGMESVGHQVIAVDAYALTEVFGLRRTEDILLAYARAYRVQAALVLPQNFVGLDFLQRLGAMGVRRVGFRYDDGLIAGPGMTRPHPTLLSLYAYADVACDLTVTCCRRAVSYVTGAGFHAPIYLPLPFAWQTVDAAEAPQEPIIVYAGSPKYQPAGPLSARVAVARSLIAAGLPIELHHDAWATVPGCEAAARPTPSREGFYRILRTSTVNLVVAADGGPTIHPMVKLLNLEIAAAGGMQVTSHCVELADYFTSETDIAYAEGVADFVTQARHYLDNPLKARQLGRNSRKAMERLAGWDVWWSDVAARLAAQGQPLDLTALPVSPDPVESTLLAAANAALAHAYTKTGETVMAAVYAHNARRYDAAKE